jgi:hypothetical protein
MKIWRANTGNNSSSNKVIAAVDNNDVVILGGNKQQPQQQQTQQKAATALAKDEPMNNTGIPSQRIPSLLFLSQPAPLVDARNDASASPQTSPKTIEKKERKPSKVSIGRNCKIQNTKQERPSSSRDLPDGILTETTEATPTSSYALSRLLFTKQNMEQRNQMKVVYTQFGSSAIDTLSVQAEDGMPSPDQADHVVVKVQVRQHDVTLSALQEKT